MANAARARRPRPGAWLALLAVVWGVDAVYGTAEVMRASAQWFPPPRPAPPPRPPGQDDGRSQHSDPLVDALLTFPFPYFLFQTPSRMTESQAHAVCAAVVEQVRQLDAREARLAEREYGAQGRCFQVAAPEACGADCVNVLWVFSHREKTPACFDLSAGGGAAWRDPEAGTKFLPHCRDDADCAHIPGLSACEGQSALCVPCTEDRHCDAGQVCIARSSVSVEHCAACRGDEHCPAATPHCSEERCLECVRDADCVGVHSVCRGGACEECAPPACKPPPPRRSPPCCKPSMTRKKRPRPRAP